RTPPAAARSIALAALVAGSALLAGCTTAATPRPDTTAASSPSPTPVGDTALLRQMDSQVAAVYSDRRPAGTFIGSASATERLPAPGEGAASKVVLALRCTGSGEYSITVRQDRPNTVGATCGDDGSGIAAVPLSNPGQPTVLDVSVPEGSDYWLTTYYTSQ
ncbi:hypothetical protein, partial [Rathayibacter tanaceti]